MDQPSVRPSIRIRLRCHSPFLTLLFAWVMLPQLRGSGGPMHRQTDARRGDRQIRGQTEAARQCTALQCHALWSPLACQLMPHIAILLVERSGAAVDGME